MRPKQDLLYGVYSRKSSESDERQVQSIDDQNSVASRLAAADDLKIVHSFAESKSAKEPGRRAAFLEMVEMIRAKKIQGIICWKLDRLSRNPDEAGMIMGMLQRGEILHIKTSERDYYPEDNALLSSVEFGLANQAIRDLSTNVKRGLGSKVEKGWRPGTVPQGYKNTKFAERGSNYIIKDEERFPLIRRAWDLMLTGNYVPEEILEILNSEWGYRTRPSKTRGERPLSRSGLYAIFNNEFYAGFIAYKGSSEMGKHEPMITIEEFDRVQFILGKSGKPRPTRYHYAYNGLLRCGECGGFVSATFKEKLMRDTGMLKSYVLYYCTTARRKKGSCSQTYTNVSLIEEDIERMLAALTISPLLLDWGLRILADQSQVVTNSDTKIKETAQRALGNAERQLEILTDLRLKELIDDEEFDARRATLKAEIARLRAQTVEAVAKEQDWVELTAETFRFSTYAHHAFLNGDEKVKRGILSSLGLNCTLKDQRLSIEAMPWLVVMSEMGPSIMCEIDTFEPALYGSDEWEKAAFTAFNPLVRSGRDLNPQPPA